MRTNAPTWVKFGQELVQRDEVYSLAGCLGISIVEGAGYIALLCAMGEAQADDDGTIDHLTTKAIEDGCCWPPARRGELLEAFCESGVIQGERDSNTNPIHISPVLWDELAGDCIKRRVENRRRQQEKRARDKGKLS
jgi:hypothetical protein